VSLDTIFRASRGSSAHLQEEHWIPLSDLMTGLMMIFMLVAIMFMVKVEASAKIETARAAVAVNDATQITRIASIYDFTKEELYRDLYNEFKSDLPVWHADLDHDLTISFHEPRILFASGKDDLPDPFKRILRSVASSQCHREWFVVVESTAQRGWKRGQGRLAACGVQGAHKRRRTDRRHFEGREKMKLPNFYDFEPLNVVKQRMGIPRERYGRLRVEITPPRLSAALLDQLGKEGREVSYKELTFLPNGTIAFGEYRVLVYIRDRGDYATLPKFHFASCTTLEEMGSSLFSVG
jgi:hypothetical protein